MILTKVTIDNYRNFDFIEVNLNEHSLLFGANDIGKTNFLMAIRLILDKSLSQVQYDADETDYCIYTNKEYISIFLEFTIEDRINDEYILSKFGKECKNKKFYVAYHASKDTSNIATFYIGANQDLKDMREIHRTYITSVINCIFLNSSRDLQSYIRRAKDRLIKDYKDNRKETEIKSDDIDSKEINTLLKQLNQKVEQISYIKKPTKKLANDLRKMSVYNETLKIKLSAINEFEEMTKNTNIITEIDGKNIEISGDGRRNQLYISLWSREKTKEANERKTFTIFLLEEPESHLHFPMQSTTMKYILTTIQNQMIVTSHSPKIVLEFNKNNLIRLYKDNNKTMVANKGCSKKLEDKVLDFGYRNNLISGEMFFSDGVFLVEGPSEELFYKELCFQCDIDLDYYNIRVLPVNGIGFKPYTKLLNQLNIPFSLRTDNDIYNRKGFKIYAGLNRLIDIYNENEIETKKLQKIKKVKTQNKNHELKETIEKLKEKLEKKALFMANKDLEYDLTDELIKIKSLKETSKKEFIKRLKRRKATNMFKLLNNGIKISFLENSDFLKPINVLISKTKGIEYNEKNNAI